VSNALRLLGSHIHAPLGLAVGTGRGLRVEDRGWSGAFTMGAVLSPIHGIWLTRSLKGFPQANAMIAAAMMRSRRRRMGAMGKSYRLSVIGY
jgi:hypothetical protein